MPALPFPAPTAGPALSPWSEYTAHDSSGTPLDIPIDPALLGDGDALPAVEYDVQSMQGVMEVGMEPWVGGCVVDDHRYPGLDIPPPPSLEEQQLAQLPPTPPLSLSQPKTDKKRRRRPPKQQPQPVQPLVETECSFCQGDDENNKHGVPEKMASCAVCGRSGHPSCIQIPHLADVIRTYEWRCQECKECEICHSKGDDSKMLFCDQCDRGWHFDCLTPPLGRAPRGKWSCPVCAPRPSTSTAQSASKSTSVPSAPLTSKHPPNKSRRKSLADSTKSKSRSKSPTQPKHKRGVPFPVLTPETDDIQVEVERQTSPSPPPPEDHPEPEPIHTSPRIATVSPQRTTTLRFKRTSTTQQPATSSSPTRPLKVRIRVTSKSDAEGPKADGDISEGANDPFGGILSAQEADTAKTTIIPNDKERFEAARVGAEARIHKSTSYFATPHTPRPTGSSSTYQLPGYVPPTRQLRSLPLRTGSPPPTTPTISTPGGILPAKAAAPAGDNGLRIKTIRFGQFDIDTWYDAPFPEEFSNIPEGRLWMCEFCLKYMRSGFQATRHKMKCKMRCPPGDEIYRDGAISVFEVDGRKNKIYCQNLCLLSKMFLDHKSLFYDVEPFLFYVMTLVDDDGARFVGYFSKEKSSPKDYNVSCIMTLPVRQRQGWGNLLIDFSYLLSKKEGRTGTPERPLSALGALSYKNYWKLTIMLFLHKAQGRIRIRDISAATSITLEDVFETLRENKLITGPGISPSSASQSAIPRKRGPGRPPRHLSDKKDDGHGHEPSTPVVLPRKYTIKWNAEEVDTYVQNWERKGHLRLKPNRLKWVPYRLTRAPVVPQVLPPVGQDAAERSESDDEPVSDGSEDLGAPVPTPALVINTLIPRPKTRSRVPTSHPSDDEGDADEDDDQHITRSMTRRSRSRQSTQTSRFDTPERRNLRSTVIGSAVLTRKASLQSHLGIGRRESPEGTPVALRSRTRSMQHLRGEQTTPMRRTTRGRPLAKDKPDSDKEPSPPVVVRKSARRGSPVRKRRRIESSPEESVTSSPGKKGADANGHDNDAEGSPDEDGPPPPPAEERAERSRSVSLGSGMVYDVRPEPAVLNGTIDATPTPTPTPTPAAESNEATPSTEPACPFTSDDGSPLTSVKEELTDDASEGPTLTADIYDDDALCDEDAEGEPDEDAEGEVDESFL